MATQEYYIREASENEARGPFNMEQLVSLAETGQVTPETLWYDPALEDWAQIASSDDLKAAIFPETRKLRMKVKEAVPTTKQSDSMAPITVEDMLAGAEGRTSETKDKIDPRIMQAHAARIGMWSAVVCMVLAAAGEILPVATGTAANALALSVLARPFEAIYCHTAAHVMTDECGAPEFYTGGAKLLGLPSPDGRLLPAQLADAVAFARGMGVHHVQPAAVTVSQASEWGTVYGLAELRALTAVAHGLGLRVHMDGARFANAVASLGVEPKEISWQAGVDVLTFGGTKNGFAVGEAVVFFNRELAYEFDYRCKQAGQLASKMRFLTAPWISMLESGAWLRNAAHANSCARLLENEVKKIPGVRIMFPSQANSVFL